MTATPRNVQARRDWLQRARVITEALPHMRVYGDATVVIKYGGHGLEGLGAFSDIVVLIRQCGVRPVVVHGGGARIDSMLERLGLPGRFRDGLRITDQQTLEVVEMVLSGSVNKEIVAAINAAGGRAVGISGKDAGLLQTTPLAGPDAEALGLVGAPAGVNPAIITTLTDNGFIPVIAPLGVDQDNRTRNVNADSAAGAIAAALRARRLLFLTDVAGVLDADGTPLSRLATSEVADLIKAGIIKGGMIPKVETCVSAVAGGVDAAVILDGRDPHTILLELYTALGAGTMIAADGAPDNRS